MDTSPIENRPETLDPDADMALRMRIAIADAAFVADGIALGLLLNWAERAKPRDDRADCDPPPGGHGDPELAATRQ